MLFVKSIAIKLNLCLFLFGHEFRFVSAALQACLVFLTYFMESALLCVYGSFLFGLYLCFILWFYAFIVAIILYFIMPTAILAEAASYVFIVHTTHNQEHTNISYFIVCCPTHHQRLATSVLLLFFVFFSTSTTQLTLSIPIGKTAWKDLLII